MSINDRELGKFNVDGKNTAKYNVRTADYSSATGTSVSVNCYLVDGPGVFYGANVIFNSAAIGSAIDKLEVKDATTNSGAIIATFISGAAATIANEKTYFPAMGISFDNGLYFAVTTATAASGIVISPVYK